MLADSPYCLYLLASSLTLHLIVSSLTHLYLFASYFTHLYLHSLIYTSYTSFLNDIILLAISKVVVGYVRHSTCSSVPKKKKKAEVVVVGIELRTWCNKLLKHGTFGGTSAFMASC